MEVQKKFATEMEKSGLANAIRREDGNEGYEYFFPINDDETVLLIDSWKNQEALDIHHKSPMMIKIIELREKYNMHMVVKRYISSDAPSNDENYIRK